MLELMLLVGGGMVLGYFLRHKIEALLGKFF